MQGERVGVLLAGGGASWEVEALRLLDTDPGRVVLLKRCVDLPDLLASASTGQARVAVASAELPGLDVDSVGRLRAAGVGLVVVAATPDPVPVLPGTHETLPAAELDRLLAAVLDAAEAAGGAGGREPRTGASVGAPQPAPPESAGPGRLVAVWGPAGAPGRTTVAVGLAASVARSHDTLLVDADPYGGAVAQHLGVLDELSGLLGAARLANAGRLDVERLAATAREVGPRLRVLTGLPRADRWPEVRESAFDAVLQAARSLSQVVVVDLGFSLEESGAGFGVGGPQRNQMTVSALDRADEVVVVGSSEPVGLARLARGLVELAETVPVAPRVVVNRVRSSLGWGEREVRAMIEGFVSPRGVHFLPYDLDAADRAVMAGRPVTDVEGSVLARAVAELGAVVAGRAPAVGERRRALRRRTAGRAR